MRETSFHTPLSLSTIDDGTQLRNNNIPRLFPYSSQLLETGYHITAELAPVVSRVVEDGIAIVPQHACCRVLAERFCTFTTVTVISCCNHALLRP